MTIPDITIRCEAVKQSRFLKRSKPCHREATFCVIINHIGPLCRTESIMFCTDHFNQASQELAGMKMMITLMIAEQIGGYIICPGCQMEITDFKQVSSVAEL